MQEESGICKNCLQEIELCNVKIIHTDGDRLLVEDSSGRVHRILTGKSLERFLKTLPDINKGYSSQWRDERARKREEEESGGSETSATEKLETL